MRKRLSRLLNLDLGSLHKMVGRKWSMTNQREKNGDLGGNRCRPDAALLGILQRGGELSVLLAVGWRP